MFAFVPRLPLLAVLLAVLAPGVSRADVGAPKPKTYAVKRTLDLRYADDSASQKLDVFSPKGLDNAPVVCVVHGGAWMIGDKNLLGFYRSIGIFFAEHGYVAVMINYRLSPFVKHPEHVKDVARAFAWTRANIKKYGGDPDRIFLCGHSAGGHLVALLASDESYLKDPALKLTNEDRAALRGVMSVCGVYRIPAPDEFQEMVRHMIEDLTKQLAAKTDAPLMMMAPSLLRPPKVPNPFRLVFGDDADVCKEASPLTHIHKGMPPFLILYAESELPTLEEMAKEFDKALENAGNEAEVTKIKDCDHNFILFKLAVPDDPAAAALLKFLAKHTGKPDSEKKP
jgi:acetyl esterase/lipase